jgi:hypothetical protein
MSYDKSSRGWLNRTITAMGLKLTHQNGKYAIGKTGDFHIDHRTWSGSISSVYSFVNGIQFAEDLMQEVLRHNPDAIKNFNLRERITKQLIMADKPTEKTE